MSSRMVLRVYLTKRGDHRNVTSQRMSCRFTRRGLHMMWQTVEAFFGERITEVAAIDIASHEGYFSYHWRSAARAFFGLEVNREASPEPSRFQAIFGLSNVQFVQANLNDLEMAAIEPADLVGFWHCLSFGKPDWCSPENCGT